MSDIEGGFDQKSLEITKKLVTSASADPRVGVDELGDAIARLESAEDRARELKRRDKGFNPRETKIALDTFTKISADEEGNIEHQDVVAFLKQQHDFALARQARPSVLQTAARRVSDSTTTIASGTARRLTRRGFMREAAITSGVAALAVIGVNRIADSQESLQRTYASIDKECTEHVPQAKAMANEQGQVVTPEDEQQALKACNDVLRRGVHGENPDQIFEPERLRRMGNTMILMVGGFGVLTQIYRGGAEVTSRIANSRIVSALRSASS